MMDVFTEFVKGNNASKCTGFLCVLVSEVSKINQRTHRVGAYIHILNSIKLFVDLEKLLN